VQHLITTSLFGYGDFFSLLAVLGKKSGSLVVVTQDKDALFVKRQARREGFSFELIEQCLNLTFQMIAIFRFADVVMREP
jgi:hypothetical protein